MKAKKNEIELVSNLFSLIVFPEDVFVVFHCSICEQHNGLTAICPSVVLLSLQMLNTPKTFYQKLLYSNDTEQIFHVIPKNDTWKNILLTRLD